jgi:hypothetical protein
VHKEVLVLKETWDHRVIQVILVHKEVLELKETWDHRVLQVT